MTAVKLVINADYIIHGLPHAVLSRGPPLSILGAYPAPREVVKRNKTKKQTIACNELIKSH